MGLSHAGTVRLVDKLVAQGLVERERDQDDHRAVRLSLSPAGQQARATILAARQRVFETMMAGLSEIERAQLEQLLDKMLGNMAHTVDPAMRMCRLCDTEACTPNCPVERADHEAAAGMH